VNGSETVGWEPLAIALHQLSLERMHLYGKLHPDDGTCNCQEWAAALQERLVALQSQEAGE
jgi:hypothetical protein